MGFNTDPSSALPIWIAPRPGGGSEAGTCEGVNLSGSVGPASSAIIAPGAFSTWFTIQNTHDSQTLYLSFNAQATTEDFSLPPKASITLPFAPLNPLNAIGSGAGTTFAVIGY
jgi:hypothetical protein